MAFKRHFLVMIWMAFSVLSLSAKEEWNADNVPIPFLQDSTQYVSDPDGYVDRALKDSANFYLQKLKLECGVQNVLIIVGRVANQDAFRMAQDVGNKYGIGYKKSRRGLVIVIAVEDHKYFIAPGSGLEGELTDVDCDDIARACIVKYMREDVPGEAVASVSRAIYNKVKSGRTGIESVDEGTVNDEEDWALVIILFLLFSESRSITSSVTSWSRWVWLNQDRRERGETSREVEMMMTTGCRRSSWAAEDSPAVEEAASRAAPLAVEHSLAAVPAEAGSSW